MVLGSKPHYHGRFVMEFQSACVFEISRGSLVFVKTNIFGKLLSPIVGHFIL